MVNKESAEPKLVRYQNETTGSVVNVDELTASQFGPGWKPATAGKK